MTCCNHDCNEGRDCPARVAKVGQRMPAPEPLPPITWRDYLPDLARAMLLTIASMTAGAVIAWVLAYA